ncbi:hypothetical protein [Massilia sp. 9I]|uniref:hypothetical protein n=1 Tax=Massilia sp. 9I TaxID=2653152 RepID=UPI0012EEF256|nr:hypothetical protein [Massilia sp. 9I]VXC05839.1 conserved hypothetical protein [Massilia sp. 9I]
MNKAPSPLWLILILALLAVFGFVGARYMLSAHSQSTQDQLGLVWPNIATMPEQERGFLVELAHTCNLTTREPVRAEVVDCLRSVPMNADASARLDRLLRQAPH